MNDRMFPTCHLVDYEDDDDDNSSKFEGSELETESFKRGSTSVSTEVSPSTSNHKPNEVHSQNRVLPESENSGLKEPSGTKNHPPRKKLKSTVPEDSEYHHITSLEFDGEDHNIKIKLPDDARRQLLDMGFSIDQVDHAIQSCGSESSAFVLADFIFAHCDIIEQEDEPKLDGQTSEEFDGEDHNIKVKLQEDAGIQLLDMGFSVDQVAQAIQSCGSESSAFVLADFIFAHCDIIEQPDEQKLDGRIYEDVKFHEDVGRQLLEMGFSIDQVAQGIQSCGSESSTSVLADFIFAHCNIVEQKINIPLTKAGPSTKSSQKRKSRETSKGYLVLKDIADYSTSSDESENDCNTGFPFDWKCVSKVVKGQENRTAVRFQEKSPPRCPKFGKKTGFGLPGFPMMKRPSPLNPLIIGPPYFYFENLEKMGKSEWDTIKRHFNGVDPEFVDSKYFSACKRSSGYVHNLPTEGRILILPIPPMTIRSTLPQTQEYWPSWDKRKRLNGINTARASDGSCSKIRSMVARYEGKDMPFHEQKLILDECRRLNLVWVGPGQVAPLEPHEIELFLGYDRDHTRGSSTITERYQALGNSFQIHTVAYHFSVLKSLYPSGVTVLSLFSGIGGAEVALHRLGILLKAVVIVEIDQKNRNVIACWWKKTNQKGKLIIKEDVKNLTYDVLDALIDHVGGFDFIIGGSPCNNLSGNNRVNRVGLQGDKSSVFYEYPRILNIVKQIMQAQCGK